MTEDLRDSQLLIQLYRGGRVTNYSEHIAIDRTHACELHINLTFVLGFIRWMETTYFYSFKKDEYTNLQ